MNFLLTNKPTRQQCPTSTQRVTQTNVEIPSLKLCTQNVSSLSPSSMHLICGCFYNPLCIFYPLILLKKLQKFLKRKNDPKMQKKVFQPALKCPITRRLVKIHNILCPLQRTNANDIIWLNCKTDEVCN